MLKFKFQQVAICIPTVADHIECIKNAEEIFDGKMYSDSLRMQGVILGGNVDVDLLLSFHHGLFDGVEVEYITSSNHKHWHKDTLLKNGNKPFLSHFGAYLDSVEFEKVVQELVNEKEFEVLQDTQSYFHSNKREGDGEHSSRHYNDVIIKTSDALGFNIKLTRKVDI